ncbi:MAG TPA: extracellular solute-binding protein [Thermoanaerobaculia bacterium]|nr:extracellular solute-binding protein [Thermoanaerobaculia bacterium]
MPIRILPLLILLALACQRDSRTPLYVYSPHGRGQLQLLERAFEEKYPGIDVRWLDMGSQEILDRLRFEKVNPQCDVWFGGPATIFDRGAREGLLAPYKPSWASHVDPRGVGPGDLHHAVYRTPAVIAYNSRAVPAEEAPQDWNDVLDPKWRKKILIRDPLASGTMRAIWGHIFQKSLRETGSTADAIDFFRRLDAQTKTYVLNPALLLEKLARQEGLVTLWDLQDVLISQNKGLPIGYVFPASGTVVIEDAIAMIRGARHPEAAKVWIEFVGSPEAQLLAARHIFRLPARLDLPSEEVPAWVARVEREMTIADVDWDLLARETPRWMTEWDQHVRGGRR